MGNPLKGPTIMYFLFFNFQVERDTAFFRNNAAKQVHKALSEKKGGHTEMLFILKLPHPSTHKNHITGRVRNQ